MIEWTRRTLKMNLRGEYSINALIDVLRSQTIELDRLQILIIRTWNNVGI